MDSHFLKLLVCPLCNSPLRHDQSHQELICQHDQLAFPIRNGIPVMLQEEARPLGQPAASRPARPAPEAGAKPTAEDLPADRAASTDAPPDARSEHASQPKP